MQHIRQQRRLFAWIAFMALFALAVVPTMSRMLAAAQGGSAWAEICTPQGARLVADAGSQGGQPVKAGMLQLDHCGLCAVAAHAMAAPPAMPVLLVAPMLADRPPLFLHSARPLFAWVTAQPRAPPSRV